MNQLPLPLSNSEIEQLFVELSNGNKHSSNKIIEHNLRLVPYVAQRYINKGYELEDLVSIGAIGLVKSVNNYNITSGKKFSNHAVDMIQKEINTYIENKELCRKVRKSNANL